MTSIKEMEKKLESALKTIEDLKGIITQTSKKSHKNKGKNIKTPPIKPRPELPYSEVPAILSEMSLEENKARFGLLYNAKNPYDISGKSIEKFYKDYNIKAYKKWYMSYNNKDIIINIQLKAHSKHKKANIERRIKFLDEKLKSLDKNKNKNVNQREKIEGFLLSQIDKLTGIING